MVRLKIFEGFENSLNFLEVLKPLKKTLFKHTKTLGKHRSDGCNYYDSVKPLKQKLLVLLLFKNLLCKGLDLYIPSKSFKSKVITFAQTYC